MTNISRAQIVLDTVLQLNTQTVQLIRLETSGYKWLISDYYNNQITFLNMDYSLFKQFTYQVDTPYYPYIKYITEVLFDNDSTDIEFLIRYFDQASSHNYIKILDENGNLLFYRDSASVDLNFAWGATPNLLNEYSITNTDSGAIMILVMDEDLSNRKREIYKLPGYMKCSVCYDPL